MKGLLKWAGLGLEALGMGADRNARSRTRKMQQAQFDATMDTSIQRRVADAQKAGVHPLFAMGASVGASPTLTGSASNVAAGARSISSGLTEMAIKAEIKKSEAEAALANSQAAVVSSRLASSGRDGVRTYRYPDEPEMDLAYGPGWVEDPARVTAMDKTGTAAGVRPAMVEVMAPDGMKHVVPNPDLFDDIGNPGALEYFRQRGVAWASGRIEDIVDYAKSVSPGRKAEIRRLESQLQALRNSRLSGDQKAQKSYEMLARAVRWLKTLRR